MVCKIYLIRTNTILPKFVPLYVSSLFTCLMQKVLWFAKVWRVGGVKGWCLSL